MARSRFWSRLTTLLLVAAAALTLSVSRQGGAVVQAGVLEQLPASTAAPTPATTHVLSYQGRLVDPATGAPKPDGSYSMTFAIYNVDTGGSALWSETKNVTVSRGLFQTLLGDTTALDLSVFDGQNLWLGVMVGGDLETTPRMRMAYTAYAIRAENANTLDGYDASDFAVAWHDHGSAYISTAGPAYMESTSTDPALSITQYSTGDGLYATTASTDPGRGAVHGRAGAAGPTINSVASVVGDSNDGRGVIGASTNNDGVLGFSTNSNGVNGQSINGYGVYALSSSSHALYAAGSAEITGNLIVGETITNPMAPIALAFINANGTKSVGSANVSSVWSSNRYEITISGYSYLWTSYVTVVTPTCGNYRANTNSVGGKLLVEMFDSTGGIAQCAFQFVTYKP